jgi:hypothetical protein
MIFNGVRLSYSRQVAHVIQLFDSKKSGNETEEERRVKVLLSEKDFN